MIYSTVSKVIAAIGAFLMSDAFYIALFWLIVPWFVTWIALLPWQRPWASASWVLSPLAVALTATAVLVCLSPGYPEPVWSVWPNDQWLGVPWVLVGYLVLAWIGPCRQAWVTATHVARVRRIVTRPPAPKKQVFEIPPPRLADPPATISTSRRIVIFCDGTSNKPDQISDGIKAPTNVYRLYSHLISNEQQTGWYDPGVATGTSSESLAGKTLGAAAKMVGWVKATQVFGGFVKFRAIIEAAFGVGITENIVQAYTEIVRLYQPGDRIYLIGFSRGAYTARCVAGVIRRCGLLKPENIRYSMDIVRLFSRREKTDQNVPIHGSYIHEQLPPVEFLGLFDTVGSLGVPMWGWWFNFRLFFRNSPLTTDPAPICIHVYHAMAMDERRAQFFPTPFDETTRSPEAWTKTLEQVWFRGGHCDVGGGYADPGLSDIALKWMLGACMKHGLVFQPELAKLLRPDPAGRIHDELQRQPAWSLLGSWPRWHPVTGPTVQQSVHPSVNARAKAFAALGRNDMTPVDFTPVQFTAGAHCEWDRTGVFLKGEGERYRLTWKWGEWQDEEFEACGPSGQVAKDLIRRALWFRRRLPHEHYMTLCITIAHPRPWPLREGGLFRLFRYLFLRDPQELRRQVAPIGRDLEKKTQSVVIQNNGGDGMLHAFANDAWMTATNNSGVLTMEIVRLRPTEEVVEPVWTLAQRVHRSKHRSGADWIPANLQPLQWSRSA